jgi:hypothetical protein
MTSVLSSFGLAAWALGLANTLPRARHAKARQKELVGIKTSLDCFVLEPLGGGFSRWGWSTTLYQRIGFIENKRHQVSACAGVIL